MGVKAIMSNVMDMIWEWSGYGACLLGFWLGWVLEKKTERMFNKEKDDYSTKKF